MQGRTMATTVTSLQYFENYFHVVFVESNFQIKMSWSQEFRRMNQRGSLTQSSSVPVFHVASGGFCDS